MKKLLIGLFFLGFTSLSYTQALPESVKELALDGITVMPANLSYLSVVSAGTQSLKVQKLQQTAASFDIKESSEYNRRSRYHEFSFAQEGGHIFATYDRNGRIISTDETYNDVSLMPPTRNTLYQKFPGWRIESNKFEVWYRLGHDPKKIFKIKLKKGDQSKRIKCDVEGNLK